MPKFINYMYPINFIGNVKRLPNTTFHLQRSNIPALSSSPITVPTGLNPIRATYDSLNYHELNWSFIVDEKLDNYMEIFDWMHGIAFPQDNDQFIGLSKDASDATLKSDIDLTILNSSKNPIASVTFYDTFPSFLGDLNFDTSANASTPLIAEVTFNYNYYSIERY